MSSLVERLFQGEEEGELDADVWEGPCDLLLARAPPWRRTENFALLLLCLCLKRTWNPALFWSSSARASVRLRAKQRPFPITTLFGPAILFKESKTACENKTNFVDFFGAVQLFKASKGPKLHVRKKHKRDKLKIKRSAITLSNSWYIPLYFISVSFLMSQ